MSHCMLLHIKQYATLSNSSMLHCLMNSLCLIQQVVSRYLRNMVILLFKCHLCLNFWQADQIISLLVTSGSFISFEMEGQVQCIALWKTSSVVWVHFIHFKWFSASTFRMIQSALLTRLAPQIQIWLPKSDSNPTWESNSMTHMSN